MQNQLLRFIVIILGLSLTPSIAQQVSDTLFRVKVIKPAYSKGKGPVVKIDEAHHNFHTASGRFRPFAILLEANGYRVERNQSALSKNALKGTQILVISNALHEKNVEDWYLPTLPAFSDAEIQQVKEWVSSGGSLFLISDHMPFPGCNEKLASAFGFTFYNSFAMDTTKQRGPDLFTKQSGRLADNEITKSLDSIYSFTGQGFDIPAAAKPLLTLDKNFTLLLPDTAWVFDQHTKRVSGARKVQGAFMNFGKGKVVVFGEAAMFTAQIQGQGNKMGFNHPIAKNNATFLLNIIRWLDK